MFSQNLLTCLTNQEMGVKKFDIKEIIIFDLKLF